MNTASNDHYLSSTRRTTEYRLLVAQRLPVRTLIYIFYFKKSVVRRVLVQHDFYNNTVEPLLSVSLGEVSL